MCLGLWARPGHMALLLHSRGTAIRTSWCWTREERSSKPYTTSATSSRALRRPWAPRRIQPGSAGTSWTVSRGWRMVRVSVGLTRVLLPVLGWAQVQEELRSMECWVLGVSHPNFCSHRDRHTASFIHSGNSLRASQRQAHGSGFEGIVERMGHM